MTSNQWFALIPIATLFTAVSGIISVLVSALISEFIRRRNRADAYASVVFTKRVEAYEKLFNLLNQHQVFSGQLGSAEEAKIAISASIHKFIDFASNHGFYVNDDIAMAAVALNMGLEDYPDLPEDKRKAYEERYFQDRKNLLHMIKQDSGIDKMNKIFKAAYQPRYQSDFIDLLNERRAELRGAAQEKIKKNTQV